MDFIVTLLVQPGDTVVMEEPVHPDMSRAMELAGAKILTDFIKEQVAQFVCDDLDPLGKEIIDCCLHDGTLDDYLALTPMKLK